MIYESGTLNLQAHVPRFVSMRRDRLPTFSHAHENDLLEGIRLLETVKIFYKIFLNIYLKSKQIRRRI